MSSFAMEEFLGDGALGGLVPKLVAGGWDDVPTVKMMNSEDMDWLKFTQQQKVLKILCAEDCLDISLLVFIVDFSYQLKNHLLCEEQAKQMFAEKWP